jgi:hypothetical protein
MWGVGMGESELIHIQVERHWYSTKIKEKVHTKDREKRMTLIDHC